MITLRPGDQTQLMRLHKMRMDRNDAHAETVGSAVGCWDRTPVNVIPLSFRRRTSVQDRHRRIFDSAIVGFSMVSLDPNVVGSDGSQMHFRGNLERFADLDILAIGIADLNIQ